MDPKKLGGGLVSMSGHGFNRAENEAPKSGFRVCVKTRPLWGTELPVLRYRPMNLRDSIVPNFLVRASGGLPRPVQG